MVIPQSSPEEQDNSKCKERDVFSTNNLNTMCLANPKQFQAYEGITTPAMVM